MTKVYRRTSLPALDNSKSVQNPDLLNIADKNYTTTIMRYSNLALLFSQLETNDKHIVGAINELNKRPILKPAKKVGETDEVGGVIIGDGLSVTEEGVLSASGTDIITSTYNVDPSSWVSDGNLYTTTLYHIPGCNSPRSNVLVIPSISDSGANNTLSTYFEAKIYADKYDPSSEGLRLHSIYKPNGYVFITFSCWESTGGEPGVILNPFYSGRKGVQTVTLSRNAWNSNNTISVIVSGVTAYSEQIIMPLPATSQANIENNLALQAANIQDAGQSTNYIYLHADNVPTRDLQIQVILNG